MTVELSPGKWGKTWDLDAGELRQCCPACKGARRADSEEKTGRQSGKCRTVGTAETQEETGLEVAGPPAAPVGSRCREAASGDSDSDSASLSTLQLLGLERSVQLQSSPCSRGERSAGRQGAVSHETVSTSQTRVLGRVKAQSKAVPPFSPCPQAATGLPAIPSVIEKKS